MHLADAFIQSKFRWYFFFCHYVWSLLVSLFHCPFIKMLKSHSGRSSHCWCCSFGSIHAMVGLGGSRLTFWKSLDVQFWWSLCSLRRPLAPLVLLAFLSLSWADHHSPGGYTFQANISMLIPETRSERSGCPPPPPPPSSPPRIYSLLKHHCYRNVITECN